MTEHVLVLATILVPTFLLMMAMITGMTEATWNALIVAATTTATSLIGLLALWLNLSRKQEVAIKATQETATKADQIIVKAEEIHSATNGHLSAMTEELKAANTRAEVSAERIAGLEKLVSEMVTAKKDTKAVKDAQDIKDLKQ